MNDENEDENIPEIRKQIRKKVSENTEKSSLFGMLADLELLAEPYFLGIEYDPDTSDLEQE